MHFVLIDVSAWRRFHRNIVRLSASYCQFQLTVLFRNSAQKIYSVSTPLFLGNPSRDLCTFQILLPAKGHGARAQYIAVIRSAQHRSRIRSRGAMIK